MKKALMFVFISMFVINTAEAGKLKFAKEIAERVYQYGKNYMKDKSNLKNKSNSKYLSGFKANSKNVGKTSFIVFKRKEFYNKYKKISESKKKKKTKQKRDKTKNKPLTLKMASWNLHNMSIKSSQKKIDAINRFILQNFLFGTDVIFFQELKENNGNSPFNVLKTYGYLSYISKPLGPNRHKEIFAILVHPKVLKNLKKIDIKPIVREINLRSYRQFKRPPYGVSIGQKDNNILILNVHIGHYGLNSNAVASRRQEVKNLKNQINMLMKRYRTDRVIVAGDFNLDHYQLKSIFKPIGKRRFIVGNTENTTAKNNYDNVISTLPITAIKIPKRIVNDISDHKPLMFVLNISRKKTK